MSMKIYLAGSIPKGDKEAKNFDNWRLRYQKALNNVFKGEFIEPYHKDLDEGDFMAIVGQDCKHIKESSLVVVNAEDRLGVGTAQELVIAKYFRKLVVTVLPVGSYHRRKDVVFFGKKVKDWIHPFIYTFSDYIVEKVEDIKDIKGKLNSTKVKDIKTIDKAIIYYTSL